MTSIHYLVKLRRHVLWHFGLLFLGHGVLYMHAELSAKARLGSEFFGIKLKLERMILITNR